MAHQRFWQAATAVALAAAIYLYFHGRISGCPEQQSGATLRLARLDVDTVRARFCYSSDCRLIAEQMNKVERAKWHCE
ncbi:hypothetical protein [Reyranella soli]|uniref:hypothetical protein n=1 Tax=Reyranella soli TaxID=1230389 RepID=UPI0011BF7774|nr:hypothetical protein [Reyranella soli]